MKDVPAKSTGSQYTAEEFEKGLNEETKNLVESSDQVLSQADQFQTAKAVANYSSAGDFFVDSGVADVYVLSAISPRQTPTKFIDGMRLRFNPVNDNTGASTVNPFALGVKSIKDQDGVDPLPGAIDSTKLLEITYKQSSDYFVISSFLSDNLVLQQVRFLDGVYQSLGAAVIPADNTKPQITEGTQIISQAFTPILTTSKILLEITVYVTSSLAAIVGAALFKDSDVDAIATGFANLSAGDEMIPITFRHEFSSVSLSAITFTVRTGASAGNIFYNGTTSTALYNGTIGSNMIITEYAI